MIATEKGPSLLENGGVFSGSTLLNFFQQRSQLKQNITHITMGKKSMAAETIWPILDPSLNYHVTNSLIRDAGIIF
jgi:hypothetical protein